MEAQKKEEQKTSHDQRPIDKAAIYATLDVATGTKRENRRGQEEPDKTSCSMSAAGDS
jgi:hypothetical protein